MRDKAGAEGETGAGIRLAVDGSALGEAKSALAALGYKPAEIQRFTEAVYKDGMSTEQIIQEALKRAVKCTPRVSRNPSWRGAQRRSNPVAQPYRNEAVDRTAADRVGKECGRTCGSRWEQYHKK